MSPLLLIFLGGWAGGAAVVRDFEIAAARDVKSKLDGPAVVRVSTRAGVSGLWQDIGSAKIFAENFSTEGLPLFTEPDRSQRGILRRLELDLKDFRLKGLPVKRLRARIPDCRFDAALALSKKQIRLSRSGTGTGEVIVGTEGLERFVLKKVPEIKRVAIDFNGNRVRVVGYGEFIVVATDFEISGQLEIRNGNQLFLVNADILFDGRPADPLSKESLLRLLNPVVDLDADLQLYGAIKLDKLKFEAGNLIASGPATIPVRPAEVQQ